MDRLADQLPPSEQLVFEGEAVHIALVRCRPQDPDFRECGGARTFCFVFPRCSVIISRPGDTFIEDPTVVSFYNRAQEYERRELSPDGDRCEWFGIAPNILRDALRPYDPAEADDERRPLRMPAAACGADLYLQQRLLFEQVRTKRAIDPLYVEESVIALLDRVISRAYALAQGRVAQPPS